MPDTKKIDHCLQMRVHCCRRNLHSFRTHHNPHHWSSLLRVGIITIGPSPPSQSASLVSAASGLVSSQSSYRIHRNPCHSPSWDRHHHNHRRQNTITISISLSQQKWIAVITIIYGIYPITVASFVGDVMAGLVSSQSLSSRIHHNPCHQPLWDRHHHSHDGQNTITVHIINRCRIAIITVITPVHHHGHHQGLGRWYRFGHHGKCSSTPSPSKSSARTWT